MLRNPDYQGCNVVEEDGAEIFRLVSGDPNIYEGGWDTPRHMKDAVVKAIEDGYNMYANRLEGLDTRLTESILGWEKRANGVQYAPEDIIPTQGVAGAIRLAFPHIMEPGGELLLTDDTPPMIVAGADLSHVGRPVGDSRELDEAFLREVERKDRQALDALVAGGRDAFVETLRGHDNSTRVCSVGCI